MQTLDDAFKSKNNNLTFIRLFAALAVIYGHTNAIVAGAPGDWIARNTHFTYAGGVAVSLFFMISGFLVTASIQRRGIKSYVVSRALRIYPALWVNLILVTFVMGAIVTSVPLADYFTSSEVWHYFTGLAGTFRGAFFLPGVFTNQFNQAVNGSIWSVLIESWLYVALAAVYLTGVMRSAGLFNCLFIILMLATWSDKSWLPIAISSATNIEVAFMFCLGSFLYINRNSIPTSPYFFLISLFLLAITLETDKAIYAFFLTILTFFCCAGFGTQFSFMEKWGNYSYGVYLYGWPCQQLTVHLFPQFTGTQNFLTASIMALICAVFSWHLVEKRAMSLKKLFFRSAEEHQKQLTARQGI